MLLNLRGAFATCMPPVLLFLVGDHVRLSNNSTLTMLVCPCPCLSRPYMFDNAVLAALWIGSREQVPASPGHRACAATILSASKHGHYVPLSHTHARDRR
jgi:hypothetical protein